jgi:hypothetical protein
MLRQMERVGLPDTPENRTLMAEHFGKVLNDSTSIAKELSGGRVTRESLLMGPKGAVKVESIWEGEKLITFKLLGGGD